MSLFLRSSYRTAQENPGCEVCQKEWIIRLVLMWEKGPDSWPQTGPCHLLATWPKTTYLSLLTLSPGHKPRVYDTWLGVSTNTAGTNSSLLGNTLTIWTRARDKLRGAYLANRPCLPLLYCWWRGLHNGDSMLPSCSPLTITYGHLPFKEHGLTLKNGQEQR